MINHLESERITLREIVEEDWRGVHRYASQSMVCKYQPWGPNTEEESRDFVKQIIEDAKTEPRSRFVFAIFDKRDDQMVGSGELNIRDFTN